MHMAKVFWTGRSQAVRLPQAFRVEAEPLRLERRGRRIIFEPVESNWLWLDTLTPLDGDAIDAARESPTKQL